jgi:hypothetical protein
MAYIGREPKAGRFVKLDNIAGSFNGSLTTFNLTVGGATPDIITSSQVIISVNAVVLEPEVGYAIRSNQIVFTTAPTGGHKFFGVLLGETFNAFRTSSTNSIGSAELKVGAINSNTFFGNGVITRHAIANNAISANTLISTGSITASLIATGAVGPTELATGAVSANTKIAANIIDASNIKAGAVGASELATGAVSANTKIGTKVITAVNIANSAIGPQHLQAGAVSANTVLATGAITADLIATGAVGPTELATGAVSANTKIAANIIDASNIKAGAVGSSELATGAVSANTKMAADVVGARELRIGNVAAANGVFTHNNNTYAKAQRSRVDSITVGAANVAIDFANTNVFNLTLGTNSNLNRPGNITVGQAGTIFVTQDGTGSRTLSYSSVWDFVGGTAPTLTTTASAVDRIDYVVYSTSRIQAVATLAYS